MTNDDMPRRYIPDGWEYTTHDHNQSGRPGLSLPASPLEKIGLEVKDSVEVELDGDQLILSKGEINKDLYARGNINCIQFSNAIHRLTEIDYDFVSYEMQAEILRLHLERIEEKIGERREDWKVNQI